MKEKDLKDLRTDYTKHVLLEDEAGKDPYALFERWFDEASKSEFEPNIMILSTGLKSPTSRVVLLKEVLDGEFVFYTNYNSRKGHDISENPNVSLLFFWGSLERQVRIEGQTKKVSPEVSDAYFASRPKESQIGAIASAQSSVLENRMDLENRVKQLTDRHSDKPISRPDNWGGYSVTPNLFEFWQGRASRLHDRLEFKLEGKNWERRRLNP